MTKRQTIEMLYDQIDALGGSLRLYAIYYKLDKMGCRNECIRTISIKNEVIGATTDKTNTFIPLEKLSKNQLGAIEKMIGYAIMAPMH